MILELPRTNRERAHCSEWTDDVKFTKRRADVRLECQRRWDGQVDRKDGEVVYLSKLPTPTLRTGGERSSDS